MSQENVEIVRDTMVEVANRGDVDALDELATADYEWHNAPDLPGGGVHRGREAVKAHLREYLDMWETYTLEEERVIDAGEQVVQLCQLHATGKGSGVTLDTPIAYVHTFRDGKFARTMAFIHHAEAVEAAGLRE
jgi:ketosteroid isomerase-like protein